VLPRTEIPALLDGEEKFPRDQLRLGLRYFFLPHVRKELASEIRAQFAAFAATGLQLSHADAHKHMHLHPTVGHLLLSIGADFGLPRIRVPAEPPDVMARCGVAKNLGARAMHAWCGVLRAQARAAGVATNDALFGLAWSGHFTEDRLLALLQHLPDGLNELYFHPAARRDARLDALMPTYEHEAELAALLSPRVRQALPPAPTSATASAGKKASRPTCSRG
jgi:hopanoid biosynthesis associated protein HpnK